MKSDEIVLANMFIGYFVPADPWPCPFRDLLLELIAVQRPFTVQFGGQDRHVRPELVLGRETSEYSLALEVKSSSVSADQVGCYVALDGAAVRRDLGFATLPTARHDVVFFTESVNIANLTRRLEGHMAHLGATVNGCPIFPILERAGNRVALTGGRVSEQAIHDVFAAGIEGDPGDSAPTHFIRFTGDSPICLLLPDAMNYVHSRIVRQSAFTTRDLCREIVGYWDERGDQERAAFLNKVHALLSKAVQEDYKPFVALGNMVPRDTGGTVWNPIDKQLNSARLQSLYAAISNFSAKYQNASNDVIRSGQMPLL